MKKSLSIIVFLAFLWLMAGCNATKKLTPAQLNLPSAIVGNGEPDSLTIADMGWWEFYGDEYLKKIIERTLANNKRLQIAASRIEEAQYVYQVNKAKLLPELNAVLPWNNETNDYYKETRLRDPEIGVKARISWEADLWGSLTWAKRKSYDQFLATMEDERAMRMLLVAEVASAYFRLVALDIELDIVRNTMSTRKEGVRLAKLRFEGGLTSETVYQQAQVQYATAAALIPNLEYSIEVTENILAILMGAYPDEKIQRSTDLKDNTLPERVPLGLPSTLLERRPDIRSSEYALRASLDNVGITYAGRFPRLTLEFTGGWEDNDFKNLFRSPFSYIAGNLVAPIFDFGRRKNNYKASIEAYEQARLRYEQKVLEVFGEVNDALARYNAARNAVTLDADLLNASYKLQDLTWKQYRGGSINYIDVLDAQRRYLDAQIALTRARRDEHLALVELYKALGGGWQVPEPEPQSN